MPTVSWIQETAEDRYWEARSKTAVGFLSPPPTYPCSRCHKQFPSADELRRHFHVSHPLELPALYISGKPLLQDSVLRHPLEEGDVEVVQCSRCELQTDGGPWTRVTLSELPRRLAQPKDATWNLRLIHERSIDKAITKEDYRLRFRIPNEAGLDAVDELFVRTLLVEQLRHADLAEFHNRLRFSSAVNEYGAALGNYVLGVLIKERRTSSNAAIAFERFAESMKESLAVLCEFQRPIALAICGCIRFNLNDFSKPPPCGSREVDSGLAFFRKIVFASVAATEIRQIESSLAGTLAPPICPVDDITHRLLTSCLKFAQVGHLTLQELEQINDLLGTGRTVSEQDIGKLHVLSAEAYMRQSQLERAIDHLHAIQFSRPFDRWARETIDSITNGR